MEIMDFLVLTGCRCGRWMGNRKFIWGDLIMIKIDISKCLMMVATMVVATVAHGSCHGSHCEDMANDEHKCEMTWMFEQVHYTDLPWSCSNVLKVLNYSISFTE